MAEAKAKNPMVSQLPPIQGELGVVPSLQPIGYLNSKTQIEPIATSLRRKGDILSVPITHQGKPLPVLGRRCKTAQHGDKMFS